MWSLSKPINLIRYLILWRVNSRFVRLPTDVSAEFSHVLGEIITDRLPTTEAAPWRKAADVWQEHLDPEAEQPRSQKSTPDPPADLSLVAPPESPWPVECVMLPYCDKRSYGAGEFLIWELKLFGDQADHDFFLEVILPAMEAAATSSRQSSGNRNSLWGHFDIYAVYAARGRTWEPFIQAGQLDLRYRPTSIQWADGLTFGHELTDPCSKIIWLTPFEFGHCEVYAKSPLYSSQRQRPKTDIFEPQLPTLLDLIEILLIRVSRLLPGKYTTADDVWSMLQADERTTLQRDLECASQNAITDQTLEPIPKAWAANWLGIQPFPAIPPPLVPYLELASILHIGKRTHFGYGTFALR